MNKEATRIVSGSTSPDGTASYTVDWEGRSTARKISDGI